MAMPITARARGARQNDLGAQGWGSGSGMASRLGSAVSISVRVTMSATVRGQAFPLTTCLFLECLIASYGCREGSGYGKSRPVFQFC